jgi:hypothetical protein
VIHGNTVLWARTSSTVCISENLGVSWYAVYSGQGIPRTIATSADDKILYILLQTEQLIRRNSTPRRILTSFPGTLINNSVSSDISHPPNNGTITATSINISSGTWALSFSFGLKALDNSSDSDVPKKITYGLGTTPNTNYIISTNRSYTIKFSIGFDKNTLCNLNKIVFYVKHLT